MNMNYLLVGGAYSVGKSESIYRLTQYLLTKGFEMVNVDKETEIKAGRDFKAILEGKNTKSKTVRILINTATDTPEIIENLKLFRDENLPVDIMISSIRDNDFWPRKSFFNILNLDCKSENIIEVPLGKITRRGNNFDVALEWYQTKIDELLIRLLYNEPFNI